jgi:hypothetical protein
MPTSAAKIRSNRLNSKKSTGPRSAAGKRAVRFNSVTHGATSESPVLPWESQAVFDERVLGIKKSIRPVGAAENILCEQIALATIQIERAVRSDIARVKSNVHTSRVEEQQETTERAAALGQRLFFEQHGPIALHPRSESEISGPRIVWSRSPDDPDHPSRLIMALEATSAGVRWLQARWRELADRLDDGECWHPPEKLKAVRLLGKLPHDVADDGDLMEIYLCCHALDPDPHGDPFGDVRADMEPKDYARLKKRLAKRNLDAKRPPDARWARSQLRDLVYRKLDELSVLATNHLGLDDAKAALKADIMGFDDSIEGERLRRHMGASQRAMHRAIDKIIKLRKDLDFHECESLEDLGDGHPARQGVLTEEGDGHLARQSELSEEGDGHPVHPVLPDLDSKGMTGKMPVPRGMETCILPVAPAVAEALNPDLQSKAKCPGLESQTEAAYGVSEQASDVDQAGNSQPYGDDEPLSHRQVLVHTSEFAHEQAVPVRAADSVSPNLEAPFEFCDPELQIEVPIPNSEIVVQRSAEHPSQEPEPETSTETRAEASPPPRESKFERQHSQPRHHATDLTSMVVRELERREFDAIARDGFRPPDRRPRIANKQGSRKPAKLEIPRASPFFAPLPPIEFSQALDEVRQELLKELNGNVHRGI